MDRYARWIDRHRIGVVVASIAIAAVCVAIAAGIEIRSDLTSLLPESQRSVRDVAAIQKRARPFGTIQIAVESDDVGARERAGDALVRRLRAIDPELVIAVSADDGPLRRHAWRNRFWFADLDDLIATRDDLAERRRAANPFYVSLDDDGDGERRLSDIEARLGDAERAAESPAPRISRDGRIQLVVVYTAFGKRDLDRARVVMRDVDAAAAEARRAAGPARS